MDELNGIVPAISNDTPGFAEQSTLHQLVIHAEELMAEAA